MDAKQQAAFAALAKQLDDAKEGGAVKFLEAGDNVFRLLVEPGTDLAINPQAFAVETQSFFQGKATTRFLMFALILQRGASVSTEEERKQVTPVLVPKSVRGSIVTLLAKGFDFFSPNGLGVVIMKSGSGYNTKYEVMPSTQPIPYVGSELIKPAKSLAEYAEEFKEWSRNRQSGDLASPNTGSAKQEASLGSPAPQKNPTGGW